MKNALVIGYGTIGKPLVLRLKAKGYSIKGVVRKGGLLSEDANTHSGKFSPGMIEPFVGSKHGGGAIFLATPSEPGGEVARDYIVAGLAAGAKVITCEKGAIGEHFDIFREDIENNRIGYSATVGGGTRLLPVLRDRLRGRKDVTAHVVLNGTLSFLFHSMHHDGDSLGAAVRKAIKLGFAEPGAESDLDVVNGEMRDTVLKTSILYNLCMRSSKTLKPSDISLHTLGEQELMRLIHEVAVRRYIVSFLPPGTKNGVSEDVIGGFCVGIDGWRIRGGFHRTDSDPLFNGRLPTGANNCVITSEGVNGEDGIYMLCNGPGAGPEPTTSAMIADAERLLSE